MIEYIKKNDFLMNVNEQKAYLVVSIFGFNAYLCKGLVSQAILHCYVPHLFRSVNLVYQFGESLIRLWCVIQL